MKNRFCYSYFSLQTNSGVISPEFGKARAVLLRVGSHSLVPASCKISNNWPRGRDSENEPGLCSCCNKGKNEGLKGNNSAVAGYNQDGAVFPAALLTFPSQTESTHNRPEVTSEEAFRARNIPSSQGILTKWVQNGA